MTSARDVLQELESLGAEQTRKTYRRHGVGEHMYGVSYADLDKLKKKLKTDQPLAEALWSSGNHDARILATKIADAPKITPDVIDGWIQDLDNYIICDALAGVTAKIPDITPKMESWLRSDDEWVGRTGWLTLANLAVNDKTLPDTYFENYLQTIEREIHTRKNYVRDAMNSALIAIGLRSQALQAKALAAAERIGKVEVDHGQTNCKTPDARGYIHKGWARKTK
jgi:3-methyladenine DNA glycosylase AlkD